MAKSISDLGTGLGYIYVIAPDGTTIIKSMLNTEENAREARDLALRGSSVALNRRPNGTITVTAVTGVGTITSITVNGNEQINIATPIAYTGATSTTALATQIKNAINTFTNVIGVTDYTATSSGAVVTVIGDDSVGDSDNGSAIVVTVSANSTNTVTTINNGSDASALYDKVYGYRFWLDADYDANGCAGSGSATDNTVGNGVEISDELIPRSLNSAIPVKNLTIASDTLTINRESIDTLVYVETQGGAGTDNLFTINADGFVNGDKVTLRGFDSAHIVTVTDNTGNIELQGDVNFVTADYETALVLQLRGSTWYEVSRTTQALGVIADYRTAGFGQFSISTFTTAAHANTGTTTFVGGTDSMYQELTGTVTLVGATHYQLQVAGAVNGDEMWLSYDTAVTVAGNAHSIFGITLTAAQSLQGGLIFHAKFISGAWQSSVSADLNAGLTNPYLIPTEMYAAESVGVAAVETTLKTETLTRRVSFETGEECDNQITMYYPGTVLDIYFTVDKVISGTDNGTITPKNNAGVAMTGGLITVTAASALDTVVGVASAPISGNHTFVAGDVLNFTTAKTTKGGFGTLSIKILKS